jgi:hypothetical protein
VIKTAVLGGTVMAALLVAGAGVAMAQTAGAAAPATTPSIRVGTTIFADYTLTETPKASDGTGEITANAFRVSRSYINVTGTITSKVSFRVTPDITTANSAGSLTGAQVFRLKYAYVNLAVTDQTSVRMGMQQTPMIDGQESVYRYRFQGTSFVERDGGLVSSDVGISMRTGLGTYGDVHVGVYNGEGYTRPEANDQKALMARVTVRPAPTHAIAKGLRLIGFVQADEYVNGAPRQRAAMSAMFEHARFNAGVDYIRRTDQPTLAAARVTGQGVSAFVNPFFKSKGDGLEGLLRIDRFEPDRDLNASWRRLIAGLAYWVPTSSRATVAVLANLEQVTYSNFSTTRPTERRFGLFALVNY